MTTRNAAYEPMPLSSPSNPGLWKISSCSARKGPIAIRAMAPDRVVSDRASGSGTGSFQTAQSTAAEMSTVTSRGTAPGIHVRSRLPKAPRSAVSKVRPRAKPYAQRGAASVVVALR